MVLVLYHLLVNCYSRSLQNWAVCKHWGNEMLTFRSVCENYCKNNIKCKNWLEWYKMHLPKWKKEQTMWQMLRICSSQKRESLCIQGGVDCIPHLLSADSIVLTSEWAFCFWMQLDGISFSSPFWWSSISPPALPYWKAIGLAACDSKYCTANQEVILRVP